MEVEMESKKANWAILGGIPLPTINSNAFTNNEIKLAKVRFVVGILGGILD